jgi:hypothetical protein
MPAWNLPALGLAVALLLQLSACADIHESEDFERHRNSQLTTPYDRNDVFYFDVILSPEVPDGDPVAEQRRMAWLEGWLEARKLCPAGYEIKDRRPFGTLEDNPGRYDLRYVVGCKVEPLPESA